MTSPASLSSRLAPPPSAAAEVPRALPGTAALYDLILALGERRTMRSLRAGIVRRARGRTLEIGAGTGLNLAHYPAAVTTRSLTEPDPAMARRLRRRAGEAAV
ncbi:MAG TPA: hypothetical protein VD836_11330, partial [Solirubrobacteraceae bacterium]|nr:hypothetical protein [Solirubrobacteraceae bacterium]